MTLLMSPVGAAAGTGLDAETLKMTLEAIRDYSRTPFPRKGNCNWTTRTCARRTWSGPCAATSWASSCCSSPRSTAGMGGGAFDVYRVCERDGPHRPGRRHRRSGHLPRQRPDHASAPRPSRRTQWLTRIADEGSSSPTARPSRKRAATSARCRPRPTPVDEPTARSPATGSPAASSGSATAASPTRTRSWRALPAGRRWFVVERGAEGFTHGQAGGQARHPPVSNTAALSLDDVVRAGRERSWAASKGRDSSRPSRCSATRA